MSVDREGREAEQQNQVESQFESELTLGRHMVDSAAQSGEVEVSPDVAVLLDSTIGMMTAAEDDAINTA